MKPKLSFLLVLVLALSLASVSTLAGEFTSDRAAFGDIDFGGATVTIVCHFNSYQRFMEGGVEGGKIEEAKKLFNIGDVTVLQVGWGDVGQTCLNRYMAGESTWDIWRVPHAYFFDLATKGALFDVSQILPGSYFEKLPKITRERNESLAVGGKKFQFSCGVPDDYGHSLFFVYNKDAFEREGLPDPYELYLNDQWTWDVVEDIAKRATRDTDGDGAIDQWGFHWIDPAYLIFANGGAITRVDENGETVFAMGEEPTLEALRRYHQWQYVDGLVQGDYQFLEFAQGKTLMAWVPYYAINGGNNWNFNFGILPFPKGPHAKDYTYPQGTADHIFIPANAENPLALVALDNFLWELWAYEEELENSIRNKAKNMESYQILMEAVEKWDGSLAYWNNFLGPWYRASDPYGAIIGGVGSGKSPASVVAEWAPVAQAKIDEVYGQ